MIYIKNWYHILVALGLIFLVYPTFTMEEKPSSNPRAESSDFFILPPIPVRPKIDYAKINLAAFLNFSGSKGESCLYLGRLQILANLFKYAPRIDTIFSKITDQPA